MTNIKKIETTETARALQSSENESSLHEEEQPTFYRLLRRCLNRNPDYQALLLLAATPWSAGLVFLTLLVPSLLVFRSTSLGFALLMTVAGLVSTGVFFLARAAVSSIQSLRERQEALDCQYQMQIKVLSHFPETNPNPVIRLGRDSRILYLNPAAEKLLESTGLDRASAREILPADMENLFDTASYEESSSFERVVTVRGKTIQYHCTAHPDEQTIILSGNDVSYLKEIENHLRHLNRNLEKYVIKRSEELNRIQDVTILCLAGLTETRDAETGEHIERTRNYVRLLAENLREQPGYREYLDETTIQTLYKSAPLHDIGKVGVPDAILFKPGKLTAEEFEEIKKHTIYGGDALRWAEDRLGSDSFLGIAREIAYYHHERWDGAGYPAGLEKDQIPYSARLMALVDVYDALVSERVYKKAFTHEKAKKIIIEGRGTQFDPAVVDAFIRIEDRFRKIAENIDV